MQTLFPALSLAFALMFTCGSVAVAHSQQLQSDGTMSSQAASAQSAQQHRQPDPAHQAKHLTRQLGLTADQSARLQPILADRDAKLATLRNDTTLDAKSMHKQHHAIALDTQSKINAILTPQQQQLYSDMRAAHQHGHGAPAPTPPQAA